MSCFSPFQGVISRLDPQGKDSCGKSIFPAPFGSPEKEEDRDCARLPSCLQHFAVLEAGSRAAPRQNQNMSAGAAQTVLGPRPYRGKTRSAWFPFSITRCKNRSRQFRSTQSAVIKSFRGKCRGPHPHPCMGMGDSTQIGVRFHPPQRPECHFPRSRQEDLPRTKRWPRKKRAGRLVRAEGTGSRACRRLEFPPRRFRSSKDSKRRWAPRSLLVSLS